MSDDTPVKQPDILHYFVDEAGDPVLFNRKKKITVGQEGCSCFFMMGMLDVAEPKMLACAAWEREINERVEALYGLYAVDRPGCRFLEATPDQRDADA